MNRITLHNGAMVISAPGYDARTASGYQQILFSSNFNALFGVFLAAQIPFGSFSLYSSISGVQPIAVYRYTLWYYKTYPSSPIVQIMWQNSNYGGASPHFNYNTIPAGVASGGETIGYYVPYTDHVDIFIQFVSNSGYIPGPTAVSIIVGHN